jgi:hypothetical protein
MVEALTIVFAVGHTRGWRWAFEGVIVALAALAALVAAFGPTLVQIPLNWLWLIVGGVLLIFGLQWLRKAVMRSSGLKAKHDEDAIYAETVAELAAEQFTAGRDHVAFMMAFEGVFLEGLEVVITVLTLGTSAHRVGLAAAVAAAAVVLVTIVGIIVAKQLSSVPENAMKTTVGIMLISYGTFWGYLPKVDTHVHRSPGFRKKTGTSCILGEASTVRSDAGLMAKACEWCRTFSCNSGGAHPLTHLVVDERQLCVDVEIAWALKLAWENKIPTSNSCQAWREWAPEEVPPPWKRRIDVDNDKDAHRLAQLLQLRRYDLDPNNWGGISLTWFNDDERC